MKAIALTGSVLFFVFFPYHLSYESTLQNPEPLKTVVLSSGTGDFEPGEVAEYDIRCLFARVGSGEIEYIGREVLDGVTVHHVRSSFSRPGAVDNEDIYGTVGDFLPIVVKREISSLGGLRLETERYDQGNYIVEIDKRKGSDRETEKLFSDGRLQNLILLLFDLRQRDLEPGMKIPVNLPGQKFVLEVKEETKVEVPFGSFDAYEVSSAGGELRVWVSARENPLVLKAVLENYLIGSYSMVLTGLAQPGA